MWGELLELWKRIRYEFRVGRMQVWHVLRYASTSLDATPYKVPFERSPERLAC